MINWLDTAECFGYDKVPSAKRPKVVCVCDKCGKKAIITIRVKSRVVDNQLQWLCPSCVKKNESADISARMKKQWEDEDYKKERQETTRKLLEDKEFKKKHKEASKIGMQKVDMSVVLRQRYIDPAAKDKIKQASIKAWANQSLRGKHSIAMNSPIVRAKCSDGARRAWKDDKYRTRMAEARAMQSARVSRIQEMLYDFLDNLDISYYREGEETRIGYYVFDCVIPNIGGKKLLIECQGDYWHSLPKSERNDKSKFTYISRYFPDCEIMYIWEHEFYCKDRVLDRLRLKLGISIQTEQFSFNQLQLRSISSCEVKEFLDLYHYLGKDRGGKAIGCFLGSNLIGSVVFSPPLRQNTTAQFDLIDGDVRELSRLCIHPSYHKKNFASWLIRRAIGFIDCKLIVAYADTTVGHIGTIYKASNFILHHIVPSDYWYVDKQGYVMHKRTLYGRAKSMKMTEQEFADRYSYIKKYGGEKLCFVKYM